MKPPRPACYSPRERRAARMSTWARIGVLAALLAVMPCVLIGGWLPPAWVSAGFWLALLAVLIWSEIDWHRHVGRHR